MADRSAGVITMTADQIERMVEFAQVCGYSHEPPPLVPKKYHAGYRYRLKPRKERAVMIDTHGIVDIPRLKIEWPPVRWLGYVMGYVKEDREPVDWDAKAMAQRPKRIFLKPE